MKVILEVKVSSQETDSDGINYLEELAKEIDLPFAPQKGMNLSLTENYDELQPSELEASNTLNKTTSSIAPRNFEVTHVYYEVDERYFLVVSFVDCQKFEEFQSIVKQLMLGYGFLKSYQVFNSI